jgi:hypothetical protein
MTIGVAVGVAIGEQTVRDSCAIRGARGVRLGGKEERPEDSLRVLEVVVHDVDQEDGIEHVRDQLTRRCVGVVQIRPLATELERFILEMTMSSRNGDIANQDNIPSTP